MFFVMDLFHVTGFLSSRGNFFIGEWETKTNVCIEIRNTLALALTIFCNLMQRYNNIK